MIGYNTSPINMAIRSSIFFYIDYIVRENLWYKLLKCGVNGKILKLVMSMYSNVKTSVFSDGEKSKQFDSVLGVRQGECLSPFLFAIYIN